MKTEREKLIDGEPFMGSDPELMADKKKAREIAGAFNNSSEDDPEYRVKLLKELFGKTGEKIQIKPPFRCDYGYKIFVGENFFANFDCVFLDAGPITFGDNCMVGPKVCIYGSTHHLEGSDRLKDGVTIPKGVTVGNNVWIGGQVALLPGITIGSNVVIGAGSVVTKSFPDNVVIAGNPARVIRELKGDE